MNRWGLLHKAGTLLQSTLSLLSASSGHCSVCAKPKGRRNGQSLFIGIHDLRQLEQQLCGECLAAIPWIRRIYCAVCGRGIVCEDCQRLPQRPFRMNRSAVQYDAAMKNWLARYKYRGEEQLHSIIGMMLIPAYERLIAQVNLNKEPNYWDAVTYVPISRERAQERGFNQAEQLAMFIATLYKLPVYHLLERSIHTEKQSFRSRIERIKGTKEIFMAKNEEVERLVGDSVQPCYRILLIDDIYTTGSTVYSCAETLRLHMDKPLDISVLTWARS